MSTRASTRVALGGIPQCLRRAEAAAYVGVSMSKFDDLVTRGLMPPPKRIDSCVIWLRDRLDAALLDLPDDGPTADNVWSDLSA
jgi:hypothetical protein